MKKNVRRIFLVLLGIGMSLVLAEAGLRLLGFGYNVIHKPRAKSAYDYSIFCLGESTTWGIGTANPFKDNYPRQLEEILNKQFPGKKIRCFFDQAIGQNSSEILLKLPNYIKKYRPNLIIIMVGVNNWWNLDKSNILVFNKNSNISNFSLKALIFLDRLRLWKLLKRTMLSLKPHEEQWNYFWPKSETLDTLVSKIEKKFGKEIWRICDELAEHDISEMVKICRANNIEVIICSYPYGREALYNIHKSISEKFKLIFVDTRSFFQSLPNINDYFDKNDKVRLHPNKKGYALLAKNIYDRIIENRLIE